MHNPTDFDAHGWRHASFHTPPKSSDDLHAVSILAWVPDSDAPDGGDVRVVWWEPKDEVWFDDAGLSREFTWWQPCPAKPVKA